MKLKTKFMKNEIQTAIAKQEYQVPHLTDLGSLTELTLAGGAANTDTVINSV